MFNYLPHTEKVRQEILQEIGLNSIEDLFANINPKVRLTGIDGLPEGISELEAQKKLSEIAQKNLTTQKSISFLGGGVYNRFIPACINTIIQRSEFITAYTPYQPEVSQGTLQVIYEYQTMICNLTGMDVANASVYDGANACAEAILMASRITKKFKALIPETINPEYKKVIETYCQSVDIDLLPYNGGKVDISKLKEELAGKNNEYSCILIQNPNYFGCIEEVVELSEICKNIGAKFIVCADPVSLAVLKSPSEYGADIVVGDIQPLGIPMAFGGPHGGFIACKNQYLRQLPGRIVGMTVDKDGERAFTLTLQTREQHIKREKATSNICSNQALIALAASIYLSVMGPQGLKEVAELSIQKAHYLAKKISEISGFQVLPSEFLYEFVIKVDDNIPFNALISELNESGILPGIKLEEKFESMENHLLVCVTEMNDISDIYMFVEMLQKLSSKYELKV